MHEESSSRIASSRRPDEAIYRQTQAIVGGDREAFADFYRARFEFMYAAARRATGRDEAFCLDVVQDAMVRVIRSMRVPFDSDESLCAWLRRVVLSSAIDRLRAEKRARQHETATGNAGAFESASSSHADALVVSEDRASDVNRPIADPLNWMHAELARLPDAQSKLIVMRYRFGWTLERIGRVVGLSPGAVDGRIRRVIAALQRNSMEDFNE